MYGTEFLKTVSFGGFDKADVLIYIDTLNNRIYDLQSELDDANRLRKSLNRSAGKLERCRKFLSERESQKEKFRIPSDISALFKNVSFGGFDKKSVLTYVQGLIDRLLAIQKDLDEAIGVIENHISSAEAEETHEDADAPAVNEIQAAVTSVVTDTAESGSEDLNGCEDFFSTVSSDGYDKKDVSDYIGSLNNEISALENELEEINILLESPDSLENAEKRRQFLVEEAGKHVFVKEDIGTRNLRTSEADGFDKMEVLMYFDDLRIAVYTLQNEIEEKTELLRSRKTGEESLQERIRALEAEIEEKDKIIDKLRKQLSVYEP